MRAKHWLRSRTLLAMLLMEGLLQACDHVDVLQAVLPVRFFAWLAFSAPILAALMRLITRHALRWRLEPRWD